MACHHNKISPKEVRVRGSGEPTGLVATSWRTCGQIKKFVVYFHTDKDRGSVQNSEVCFLVCAGCAADGTVCPLSYDLILEHSACIQEHSGTFCMHSRTFWNILHAFWNILEHSAYILEHYGTFCMYSGIFWNFLHALWKILELSACIL